MTGEDMPARNGERSRAGTGGAKAVLAGSGRLPVEGVLALRRAGESEPVVAIALVEAVEPELASLASQYYRIPVTRWQEVVDTLRAAGCRRCYFLGKVEKRGLVAGTAGRHDGGGTAGGGDGDKAAARVGGGAGDGVTGQARGGMRGNRRAQWDARALRLLEGLQAKPDGAVFARLAADLAGAGIEIGRQDELLASLLAPPGEWTGLGITADEESMIDHGFQLARLLADLDIGQTVVLKEGVVMAVEAAEGTDACLRRGARLAGPGAIAVKACGKEQDPRFDLPTIGPETVAVLRRGGYRLLAVEAGHTLVIDGERTVAEARAAGIKLVGWSR
ncbi:MAG TPA: LpxI family protein [Firmicutes bacterium]|nr:LpxI family protein [Bacillota bacterium]